MPVSAGFPCTGQCLPRKSFPSARCFKGSWGEIHTRERNVKCPSEQLPRGIPLLGVEIHLSSALAKMAEAMTHLTCFLGLPWLPRIQWEVLGCGCPGGRGGWGRSRNALLTVEGSQTALERVGPPGH